MTAVTTTVRVHVRDADGGTAEIEAPVGGSIMQAAVSQGVRGIVAECGGNASCGTCHVFVESSGAAFAPPSDDEDEMLDCTATPRESDSRLSCQLVVGAEHDPVVIRLPERQT